MKDLSPRFWIVVGVFALIYLAVDGVLILFYMESIDRPWWAIALEACILLVLLLCGYMGIRELSKKKA